MSRYQDLVHANDKPFYVIYCRDSTSPGQSLSLQKRLVARDANCPMFLKKRTPVEALVVDPVRMLDRMVPLCKAKEAVTALALQVALM